MNKIDQTELDKMLDFAYEAMTRSYAPYSKFHVGACLRAASGKYYCGCNIENAAFTPTVCAERTALFKAVFEGERAFDAIAVVCSGDNPAYPCGVCRQALNEFCSPDMPVYCGSAERKTELLTLGDLLPRSFGPRDLQ